MRTWPASRCGGSPRFFETWWFAPALVLLALVSAWGIHRARVARHMRLEAELQARIRDARAEIETLSGLLPLCAGCRRVRDDVGYWTEIEAYVSAHTAAAFSHGICPDCLAQHRGRLRGAIVRVKSQAGIESLAAANPDSR